MTSTNATKSPQTNPSRPRHPLNPFSSIKPLVGFIVVCVSLYYSLNFLRLPARNAIPALPEGEEMSRKKCIVYHTNWANYARNFQVKDIPLQGITDIAYAFFNLQDSGGGLYKIVSGDTYPPYYSRKPTENVDGQTSRIRSLARVLNLKIHGLLHPLIWDYSANSINSTIPLPAHSVFNSQSEDGPGPNTFLSLYEHMNHDLHLQKV